MGRETRLLCFASDRATRKLLALTCEAGNHHNHPFAWENVSAGKHAQHATARMIARHVLEHMPCDPERCSVLHRGARKEYNQWAGCGGAPSGAQLLQPPLGAILDSRACLASLARCGSRTLIVRPVFDPPEKSCQHLPANEFCKLPGQWSCSNALLSHGVPGQRLVDSWLGVVLVQLIGPAPGGFA